MRYHGARRDALKGGRAIRRATRKEDEEACCARGERLITRDRC